MIVFCLTYLSVQFYLYEMSLKSELHFSSVMLANSGLMG